MSAELVNAVKELTMRVVQYENEADDDMKRGRLDQVYKQGKAAIEVAVKAGQTDVANALSDLQYRQGGADWDGIKSGIKVAINKLGILDQLHEDAKDLFSRVETYDGGRRRRKSRKAKKSRKTRKGKKATRRR